MIASDWECLWNIPGTFERVSGVLSHEISDHYIRKIGERTLSFQVVPQTLRAFAVLVFMKPWVSLKYC